MYDFSILREIRKGEGYTIDDVSRQSGVSVPVISKLERNQTKAELETIYKLARVFGMSATDLISLAESRLSHRKQAESYQSGGYHFEKIEYANLRCFMGQAPKGTKLSKPEIHRDDYEFCWVLEGKIQVKLPHESVILETGQSVQFDAIQEHTYEALEDTKILIIHLRKQNRF